MTIDYSNFIGKPVAIRGIGSGVNVGICGGFEGKTVLLEPGSFFCRRWEYKDSFGSFHSLANGDVQKGSIAKVTHDTVITDVAQIVVCDPSVIPVLDACAV